MTDRIVLTPKTRVSVEGRRQPGPKLGVNALGVGFVDKTVLVQSRQQCRAVSWYEDRLNRVSDILMVGQEVEKATIGPRKRSDAEVEAEQMLVTVER